MVAENDFVCHDCFKLKKCKDSTASWVLFIIALTATISIRAVNVVLDFSQLWAKVFWYIGIVGFTIFFVYKYRYQNLLQKELTKSKLADKLLTKDNLTDHDYEILGTVLCKISSKKDKITFLFIFVSSAIALALAIWADFIR